MAQRNKKTKKWRKNWVDITYDSDISCSWYISSIFIKLGNSCQENEQIYQVKNDKIRSIWIKRR